MLVSATARALQPLTGAAVAHLVDFTDMPQEATRVVAAAPFGPTAGWSSLDAALAGVQSLRATSGGDDAQDVGVFQRGGHFEAYLLEQSIDSQPGWHQPLTSYWSDGEMAFARTEAGTALRAIVDNGDVHAASSYASLRHHLRFGK